MTFDFDKLITIGSDKWKTAPFRFYGEKEPFFIGNKIEQKWQDVILSGNTALTLVNAKADGLNYVKLFGGTEQRNIPSGYTQVEYLQSTDTQYINTGVVPKTSLSVKIKYNILQLAASNNIAIFGSISSQTGLFSGIAGSPAAYYINSGATSLPDIPYALNTIREEEYTYNTMIRNSVTYTTPTIVENNIPMVLFGRNTGSEVARIGSLRIYYFALYDNGVLIQNLVPVKRNSDNVLGMYDTVTGNFLTNSGTGSFTAGSNVVPTPNTPMDIVSNNGALKAYPNLFDKNSLTLGYIDDTGNIQTSTVSAYSAAIPVLPNTTYVLSGLSFYSGSAYLRIHGYNNQDAWTSMLKKTNIESEIINPIILTTGSSDYYVRFSYVRDNMLDAQLRRNGLYTDGTVETVEIHGKNLFDKNNNGLGNGYISATTGAVVGTGRGHTGYFRVKPNTTYHVTLDEYQQGSTNGIAYYDNDKNFVVGKASGTSYGNPPYNFTVPDNNSIVYARLTLTNNIASTNLNVIQIEQGTTATTYEPYFNGGTATAEMLLKVGTYKDVQNVLDGSVTRNIGIKVLDGTEDWVSLSGSPYVSLLKTAINMISDTNATCLMTSLKQVLHADINTSTNCFSVGANYLNCKLSAATNVSQFKQYLTDQYNAGTPVIVVYPLATATTETVTGQELTTQAGTNIVEITQASIDNLPLEVSYKAGVRVTITEVQNAQLSNQVTVTIGG